MVDLVQVENIKIRPHCGRISGGVLSARGPSNAPGTGEEVHAGQLRLRANLFETHCGWVGAFVDKLHF